MIFASMCDLITNIGEEENQYFNLWGKKTEMTHTTILNVDCAPTIDIDRKKLRTLVMAKE